jgi:hypothetical protein
MDVLGHGLQERGLAHLNRRARRVRGSQRDQLLIGAVDALHETSDVPEPLWGQLAAEFSEAELLDLLMLCGWYHAISFAARAIRLEPESWAPAFTGPARNDLGTRRA